MQVYAPEAKEEISNSAYRQSIANLGREPVPVKVRFHHLDAPL